MNSHNLTTLIFEELSQLQSQEIQAFVRVRVFELQELLDRIVRAMWGTVGDITAWRSYTVVTFILRTMRKDLKSSNTVGNLPQYNNEIEKKWYMGTFHGTIMSKLLGAHCQSCSARTHMTDEMKPIGRLMKKIHFHPMLLTIEPGGQVFGGEIVAYQRN